jgi:eukaryotic-like serine/threonine-protein kinase
MSSELTTATPNWTALQGKVLDGGYEIGECLLANPASASFKVRVLGDRYMQAVVNVFTREAAPLEQYELWQEALELRHPNVSTPIAVGRLDWDGVAYPYVVLYKADENLAGVLGERALGVDETRELLRSVGAGLEYLHANGFVHSVLGPERILAMGNSIQLSITSIRRINTPLEGESESGFKAPESAGENLTVPADIWCLGATLYEVLTQKTCGEDCREQAKSLPVPFDWIVERCLDPEPHERPTLSELFAILSGELKRPEPVPEPPPAVMAASAGVAVAGPAPALAPVTAMPANGTGTAVRPAMKPANGPISPRPLGPRPVESPRPKLAPSPKPVYTETRTRRPEFVDEKPHESPRTKFLTYAFLAIVLAGGLLWLARPKPEKPRPTVNPVARTQTATPTPGSETRTVQPRSTTPHDTSRAPVASAAVAPAAAPATTNTAGPSGKADTWRVVVFTFARRADAEKRAQALGQEHPGFNPEVFSRNNSGPYMVVLGGPMSHDDAMRLRQKARASGFPRDSYAQNFNH